MSHHLTWLLDDESIRRIERGGNLIIRDNGVFFTLIRQHDHGLLSGEIASHWGNQDFSRPRDKLILTASLHDLSWIENDAVLHWNEKENKPYDFTSLPFKVRLPMYKKGLDLTERLHPYGSLLTSKHYCSFFTKGENRDVDEFLEKEEVRQERLKSSFFEEPLEKDLRDLQTWDNLSLYLCLNRPGVAKENEHPWFKEGIQAFNKNGESVTLHLRWLNERTVTLNPFPFSESWSTTLPYAQVRKTLGPNDPDREKAYPRHIRFVPS